MLITLKKQHTFFKIFMKFWKNAPSVLKNIHLLPPFMKLLRDKLIGKLGLRACCPWQIDLINVKDSLFTSHVSLN